MREYREEYEVLISGYLDGELTPDQAVRLEQIIAESPACQEEFETMKRLVYGTNAACCPSEPPDEVWDTFLDNVYNRAERRLGWLVLIAGTIALSGYGLYLYFAEPWTSAAVKLLIAAPVLGLVMLFINVLRQRLRAAKHDRYSREVHR
jgi:anti-sigma factor RsiW